MTARDPVAPAGLSTAGLSLQVSAGAHLHPGDPAHAPRHDPRHGPLAADGRPFVRAGHYPLPYVRWCTTGGVAVLARYATDVSHHPRWQAVPSSLPERLRAEWLDVCE